MSALDHETLSRFVSLAGDRLEGDWVVLGGCVLPLLGVEHRTTFDIDVAGPDESDMGQMLAVMEIAEELGLPVSAINQAGSHFLRRIEDWRDHIVPLHRGARASIHVPDATLFLLLKLPRLSESDLLDCLEMLRLAVRRNEKPDGARVRRAVQEALEGDPAPTRRAHLQRLLEALDATGAG